MTSAPQPARPTAPAADDDLRLVLFGRPAAGKSSLLAALARSAQSRQDLLGGALEDRTGNLAELARRPHDSADRLPGEVLPFPVRYRPLGPDGRLAAPLDAVILDCDGTVANRMLLDHSTLHEDSPEGTLAHEVADADALLLVLDASEPSSRLEAEFDEFGRFLRAMRQVRGEQVEVAGLPVFLVLTKCDRLAEPGDGAAAWMERIEGRKRDADIRFRAYLHAAKPAAPAKEEPAAAARAEEALAGSEFDAPFGRLDLHVWATATRRPALRPSAGQAGEPYGVAELFRQALAAAAAYRRRHERSARRLAGLVIGSGLLVTVMLTLSVLLYFFNLTTRAGELRRRVEEYRYHDHDTPAERLKASAERLRDRQRLLREIRADEVFPRIPADLREFVEERLEELDAYLPYLEKLTAEPHPATATTEEGLEKAIARLRDDLAPPRRGWEETPAGLLRKGRLESAESLRKAVQAVRNWYLDGSDQAGRLWSFADYPAGDIDWVEWSSRVEKLLERMRKPPFGDAEPVPGVQGGALTFLTVMRFDRVAEARASWDLDRARLTRVLHLASAVGLVEPTADRPAVLVFGRDFSLKGARARVALLKSAYPDYEKSFVREGLPDEFLPRLRAAARRQYDHLLEPGRAEVLRQLRASGRGAEETAGRWEAVRGWLRQPEELASWRELARVVARLVEAGAADPVTALQEFLARGQFELKLQSLTLEVPELRGLKPRAEGRLLVYPPGGDPQAPLAFEPTGEPTRDAARRLRVYTFRLANAKTIPYRPGDRLWAELPLTGGRERLVWSHSRSSLYQFERLRQAPRLQSSDATSLEEGRLLEDVRLVPRPEDGVPAVPALMPWVRLGE